MAQILDNNLEHYIYDYRIKVGETLKKMRENGKEHIGTFFMN